jgi:DNA-binding XRE family transcriptional regulator
MSKKHIDLARARRRAGLKQAELAELADVDISTIQNHERDGIPKKLMEYGYKFIFEMISKK